MDEDILVLRIKRSLFEWSSFLPLKSMVETFIKQQKEKNDESIYEQTLWEFQSKISNETLNSVLFRLYPPCPKSTTAFIKKLLLVFENNQVEGNNSFYEYVTNSENIHEQEVQFFKSYFDECGSHLVSLIETNELICNGTTGLRTWQAGKFLYEWILKNLHYFPKNEEYSILELGSGVGYTGLCIFNDDRCSVRHITLTDHHPSVLNALHQNVNANLCSIKKKSVDERTIVFPKKFTASDGKSERTVIIDSLDWENFGFKESDPDNYLCDIVIGADIVFDVSVIPYLLNVIVKFLRNLGTQKVILANCLRNEKTDEFFANELTNRNLTVKKETHMVDDNLPLNLYVIE